MHFEGLFIGVVILGPDHRDFAKHRSALELPQLNLQAAIQHCEDALRGEHTEVAGHCLSEYVLPTTTLCNNQQQ